MAYDLYIWPSSWIFLINLNRYMARRLVSILKSRWRQFRFSCDINNTLKFVVNKPLSRWKIPEKKIHGPKNINIFQTVKKSFDSAGIGPNSATFHTKISLILLVLGLGSLFNEAETFFELAQSIYMCSAFFAVVFAFMKVIFNLNKFLILMNDWECLINTSKLNKIKHQSTIPTSRAYFSIFFSQYFSIWICSIAIISHGNTLSSGKTEWNYIVKMAPSILTLLVLVRSAFIYLISDLCSGAFILPIPMWWA